MSPTQTVEAFHEVVTSRYQEIGDSYEATLDDVAQATSAEEIEVVNASVNVVVERASSQNR
jgi:hypothetical protein